MIPTLPEVVDYNYKGINKLNMFWNHSRLDKDSRCSRSLKFFFDTRNNKYQRHWFKSYQILAK